MNNINSFDYNYNPNINKINNLPSDMPKFVNPFLIQNNNKYPTFDDDNDYSKKSNDNNYNFNNNNNNYNNNYNFYDINKIDSNENNYKKNSNNSNNFNNNPNINNNMNYNNFDSNWNNNNNKNSFGNNYNNFNSNGNNYNNINSIDNNNYNNNINSGGNNYNNINSFDNNYKNINSTGNNFNNMNSNWNNYNNINSNENNFNNKQNNFEVINDSFTQNLIRTMSVLNSSKNSSWKDNIKSFVSSLYYNNHNFSIKLTKESLRYPLYIFDKRIDKIIRDELKYPLHSFLYMSYKSGFNNLNNIGCQNYTSDCGWGCMLRCCQMLLSKALIQKKIYDFFEKGNSTLINYKAIQKIRNDILNLFNDNYLPVAIARESEHYSYFWHLYETFARENPIFNSIKEIIPPFSIHILSKLGECAGVYTSNNKMIKVICQINSAIFNSLSFVHFESGNISKKKLITTFCEECASFCEEKDLLTYSGVDYKFIKGGIIFVTLRLGLQNLDESYYNLIPLIFRKIRHNFGIVGGRNNRAYYFIGVQGDNKLIFSDPHLNQEITGNLLKDNEKYFNENLYLMDIKEMSSSFSFGVGIFNKNHLMQFFEDIDWFNKSEFKDCIYYS